MMSSSLAADQGVTWAAGLTAVTSALTFIALAVAAAFGFLRFTQKRELRATCEISLDGRIVAVLDEEALLPSVSFTNNGTLRLEFPEGTGCILTIASVDRAMWDDAQNNGGETLWSEGILYQLDLLAQEGDRDDQKTLEPNERKTRRLLIPIFKGSSLAYWIHFNVKACRDMVHSRG